MDSYLSNYIGDLGTTYNIKSNNTTPDIKHNTDKKAGADLDMTDYLTLMVTMLQNQSIDDTVDTGEMMSQMVQMSVVSAITEISQLVQDSTTLNYAASLVGKTVTIGAYDDSGLLQEFEGEVTGTGMMNGKQVVFVNDKPYELSSIMAVGKLPPKENLQGSGENAEGSEIAS